MVATTNSFGVQSGPLLGDVAALGVAIARNAALRYCTRHDYWNWRGIAPISGIYRSENAREKRVIRLHPSGSLVLGMLCLLSCAARDVTPVSMSQAGDKQRGCPELFEQLKQNRADAADLLRKDKGVEAANTVKIGVGSVLVPIGLLLAVTADFSNEEQVKARSIADRNEYLIYLAKQKDCHDT